MTKPTAAARATPAGSRGHTRPSSEASWGSSVEDGTTAL